MILGYLPVFGSQSPVSNLLSNRDWALVTGYWKALVPIFLLPGQFLYLHTSVVWSGRVEIEEMGLEIYSLHVLWDVWFLSGP